MNTLRHRRAMTACCLVATCLTLAACSSHRLIHPAPELNARVVEGQWLGINSRIGSAVIMLTVEPDGQMEWHQQYTSPHREPRTWQGWVAWSEEHWALLFEREGEEPLRFHYSDGAPLNVFTLHPLDREKRWTTATFARAELVRERLPEHPDQP